MDPGSGLDTDDDTKRKREQDQDETFGTSKMTKRTPHKNIKQYKEQPQEQTLIHMMQDLMSKNKEMMEEIKQIRAEQRKYHEELKTVKAENVQMKTEIKRLQERTEQLEKITKKKNLIVTGIKIENSDEKQLKGKMEKFLEEELKLKIKLRGAGKISDKVYVIETEDMTDKLNILKHKKDLRKLTDRIYINTDLTKREREIQKELQKLASEERRNGNTVKIGYKKLIINDEEWSWDEEGGKLQKPRTPKN